MLQKLRFGGALMILGGLVAAVGEVVNIFNIDVLSSGWRLSLGLIVIGMLVLLVGLSPFSSVSPKIDGLGFFGSILLTLGGLVMIVGTLALDWVILPFLINLANIVAASINQPAAVAENELNNVVATLNGLGSSLQRVFPGAVPHVSVVHIARANGRQLVDSVLVQLNVPTIDQLQWWGHFSLTGAPLALGSVILGLALLARYGRPTPTAVLLILLSLLNLLCQFVPTIPALYGNLTAGALFLTLAWLGLSAWSERPGEIPGFANQEEVVYLEP